MTEKKAETTEELDRRALARGLDILLKKQGSAAFPWLTALEEGERRDFFQELYTALDNTRYGVPNPNSLDYVKALDEVVVPWRSTAQAKADGLVQVLATATMGDFGPVDPPYAPRYAVHSIITTDGKTDWGDRYRVIAVRDTGDYELRPLYSGGDVDLVLWEWRDCDEHTRLEWLDRAPRYGRKENGKAPRLIADDEREEAGDG